MSGGVALRRARHKHFVVVLCEQQSQRCAVAALFFMTRTVDNTVELYAAKPDICPESRFLPTPTCIRCPAIPLASEKLEWLGYPMVKKFRRYLYLF